MNEIALNQDSQIKHVSLADEIEKNRTLIQQTFFKDGNPAQFELFLEVAKRVGLSPLNRQITPMIRRSKNKQTGQWEQQMTIITNIDGFRVIAERSGKYAGQVGPFWCGEDGEWKEVWLQKDPPRAAKVGVLRSDFKEPLWGVATWDSYVQTYERDGRTTLGPMWAKMPDIMLAKVAEALALRKAFPQDLSGLYSADEMDQAKEKVTNPTEYEETPKLPKPKKSTSAVTPPQETTKPPNQSTHTQSPIGQQSNATAYSETTSNYIIPFGKFKGKTFKEVKPEDLESYAMYLYKGMSETTAQGKKPNDSVIRFLEELEMFTGEIIQDGEIVGETIRRGNGAPSTNSKPITSEDEALKAYNEIPF